MQMLLMMMDGFEVPGELQKRFAEADAPALSRISEWYGHAGSEIWSELAKYYRILSDSLAEIDLSEEEARLLIQATRGVIHTEYCYRDLAYDVEEAIRWGEAAAPVQFDLEAFLEKLRSLSPGGAVAVLDAAARFRALHSAPAIRRRHVAELLVEVGLVRDSGEPIA